MERRRKSVIDIETILNAEMIPRMPKKNLTDRFIRSAAKSTVRADRITSARTSNASTIGSRPRSSRRSRPASAPAQLTTVPKPLKNPPLSFEAVRRQIQLSVYPLELQLKAFQEEWLTGTPYPKEHRLRERWIELIETLYWRLKLDKSYLVNKKMFETVLSKFKNDKAIISKSEYQQLTHVCARDNAFAEIHKTMKSKFMFIIFELMERYLVSFCEESNNLDIAPVQKYEERIITWKNTLHKFLAEFKTIDKDLERYRNASMSRFVSNYEKIYHFIERAIQMYQKICKIARRWIIEDENYPRFLQAEAKILIRQKDNYQLQIRHLAVQKTTENHKMKGTSYDNQKYYEKLESKKNDESDNIRMELNLGEQIMTLETDIEVKKQTLQDLQFQLSDKSECDQMQREIRHLEAKCRSMKLEQKNLQRKQSCLARDVHQLENIIEERERSDRMTTGKLTRQELVFKERHEQVRVLEAKIAAINKIIGLRQTRDAVKTLHQEAIKEAGKGDQSWLMFLLSDESDGDESGVSVTISRIANEKDDFNPKVAQKAVKQWRSTIPGNKRVSSAGSSKGLLGGKKQTIKFQGKKAEPTPVPKVTSLVLNLMPSLAWKEN